MNRVGFSCFQDDEVVRVVYGCSKERWIDRLILFDGFSRGLNPGRGVSKRRQTKLQ